MCLATDAIIVGVITTIYYFLSTSFTPFENRLYCSLLWIEGSPCSWEPKQEEDGTRFTKEYNILH